jgi:hypothetical protein
MKTKGKVEIGNKTRRNINIKFIQKKLSDLMEKGKEKYAPKIGRKAKQLKKKIKKLEK